MYNIIQKRKIWLSISGFLVIASVFSLAIWRLDLGIDFTGGALLELNFKNERPSVSEVQSALSDLNLGSLQAQPVEEKGMILRFQDISEDKHQETLKRLDSLSGSADANATTSEEVVLASIEELRFDSVGANIGKELKSRSVNAIFIVLAAIVAYIAWTFRKVSKPVASWKYGIAAVIALFHDVLITLGVFSVLGYIYNIEVNTAFIAAILTVLGYSINDTIVVFDRIRENLPKSDLDFENTVNLSVNQTIRRSINTSFTTLLVLVSILIFGGPSIRDFVLALSIGIFIGTYSSIFVASPVLVIWENWSRNRLKA